MVIFILKEKNIFNAAKGQRKPSHHAVGFLLYSGSNNEEGVREGGSHIRKVCGKVGVTLGRCVGRWESHEEGV